MYVKKYLSIFVYNIFLFSIVENKVKNIKEKGNFNFGQHKC